MASALFEQNPYKLYYWPGIPGRGEVIRMVMELADVKYIDVGIEEGMEALMDFKNSPHGHFALPILEVNPKFSLSQTAVILAYLGRRHGLSPLGDKAFTASQIGATIMDIMDEMHNTHHPVDLTDTYEGQMTEAKRAAKTVSQKRLGPYMDYLERCVSMYNETKNPYMFNGKMSFVDVAIAYLLRGIEHSFPNTYSDTLVPRMPKLLAIRESIEGNEKIVEFMNSNRSVDFSTGIFRYYSELQD